MSFRQKYNIVRDNPNASTLSIPGPETLYRIEYPPYSRLKTIVKSYYIFSLNMLHVLRLIDYWL